jgi:hypothetical protein
LPEFRLRDPIATEQASLRDLLTHRTGLPRHDWVRMDGHLNNADMLAALCHLEPSKPFCGAWQYNNLMYLVAGLVLERVSGECWTLDPVTGRGGLRLSPAAATELTAPQIYIARSDFAGIGPVHYGLGFFVGHYRGARRVDHAGGPWRDHPSNDRSVRVQARRRDTSPSHALADYANEYAHPAYGKVHITCDGPRYAGRGSASICR